MFVCLLVSDYLGHGTVGCGTNGHGTVGCEMVVCKTVGCRMVSCGMVDRGMIGCGTVISHKLNKLYCDFKRVLVPL